MKIDILKENDDEIQFRISGVNTGFVNALRRVMIAKIPTLAIDNVSIIKNNSGLFDEVLAHRLGLIPWKFNRENFKDDEIHSSDLEKEITITMDEEGKKRVTSGDLNVENADISPEEDEIPVVQLLEDQRVKLRTTAKFGNGEKHAKWQAANASYFNYPQIEVEEVEDPELIIENCPADVFEHSNGELKVKNEKACQLCRLCEKISENNITVEEKENDFIFNLESISGLDPKEIITQSVNELKRELEDFEQSVSS